MWATVFRSAALVLALAACAEREPRLAFAPDRPLSKDYLQVVSASSDMVEVDSAGRLVRAVAPEGLCIPTDSVLTGPGRVFLLMNDCGGDEPLGGVLSVTVANKPLDGNLGALETFLRSGLGLVSLGYGGGAGDVELIETKRIEGALIATVEDRSEFGPAFAGDLICRAFTELNGRMTVISLISRRDDPQTPADLRKRLRNIVESLQSENA